MARTVFAITAILVPILTFLLDAVDSHYTPTWAVHVPGGKEAADAVATEYGFINLGEIINNHYHFHHNGVSKRSLSPAHAHHGQLAADDRVRWAKQQRALSRKKRDFVAMSTAEALSSWAPEVPSTSSTKREVSWRREQQSARLKARPRSADIKFQLNDPKWPHMWYLNRGGGLDMNVIPAWREGITGRGVVVTILDDGLETDHPDLVANYDPMASYDVNSHDSDPQPRYDLIDSNRHGTRCAGEVAATSNNSLCAVGVAFGARVGGVRMLDGDVTDAVEARSLSLNPQHVDIYSASWGPDDDGKTVDGPGELATRAFIEGVTKGRNGKGSIFVWASGNGGREQDNCNCDGYTNSIWTLSISSATERGEVPWYSEMCSSTLAATYSSGAINEKQIVTTDLHHSCTSGHTGTSASAPLAAGICALALQANRDLTWRDMQHIVVRTARPERLSANGHWHTNGVGRNVSHSFGYGLLDAAGMVRLARSWRTVPPQRRCELAAPRSQQRNVPPKSTITLQLDVTSCPGVNFLEHVQARVSLAAARRGDLRITLTSPAGTTVVLLAPRSHDSSRAGFTSWPFMSVHMWGESPMGVWQLQVYNEGRFMAGPLSQWEMIFYGTETPPQETYSQETNGLDQSSTWSGAAKEAAGGQDVEHNALDDDLALVWHDSQTIRDEGQALDHQQPTPKTNGCARTSSQPTHHCLECAKGFHLFDGRCYAQCPNGTFASEMDTSRGSRRRNGTVFTEAMVKRHPGERFSEADDMSAPLVCAPCHYTCPVCSGPESYQCLACADDAVLFNRTSGPDREPRHYCYPSSILPQIDNNRQENTNTFVVVALFVFTSVSLYFILAFILKRWCFVANMRNGEVHSNLGYVKLQNSESQQKAHDIENEVRQAIVNSTDSESDEDLHL